ncbi:hypothetical protein TRFO_36942 [Tritrichomonas foetus]|uniref:Uncharacterized protein n=1 Tax=Tritrichomonas foetus TaxID=1144522 RepID=A0A1J4JDR2_9EUKA|nr:hypothetical protein TRFO_36942 [Tritrichomonas foetus]|eukprot:OHS96793.1 hypothetical protein TRFO_36942 [Tritrichomonas foetus]
MDFDFQIYNSVLKMKLGQGHTSTIKEFLYTWDFLIGIAHLQSFRTNGNEIFAEIKSAFHMNFKILNDALNDLNGQIRPFDNGRSIHRKKDIIIPQLLQVLSDAEFTYVMSFLDDRLSQNIEGQLPGEFIGQINKILSKTITFSLEIPPRREIEMIENASDFVSNATDFLNHFNLKSNDKNNEINIRGALNYVCFYVSEMIISNLKSHDDTKKLIAIHCINHIKTLDFYNTYVRYYQKNYNDMIKRKLENSQTSIIIEPFHVNPNELKFYPIPMIKGYSELNENQDDNHDDHFCYNESDDDFSMIDNLIVNF